MNYLVIVFVSFLLQVTNVQKTVQERKKYMKNKNQEVQVPADEKSEGKRATATKNPNAYIVLVNDPVVIDGKKLPRQAKVCAKIFARNSEKNFSEDVAKKLINDGAAEIVTRQDPWRIFQYYRARLIAEGLIKMGS